MEGETDMPMVPLSWLADHVDVPEGTDAEALAAAKYRTAPNTEDGVARFIEQYIL